jgi:hypothetical protein
MHHYLTIIHDAAKAAKPDALIVTHCPHPYFADVTDVLRINDFSIVTRNVETQARYRVGIARAVSDWLINTDNWPLYDLDQWRDYLAIQPELGIPASWYARLFWGGYLGADSGTQREEVLTEDDYRRWREIWVAYRRDKGLS